MREAVAGRTGATETKFCDEASDQLSDAIPRDIGCPGDLTCEHLADLIRGEQGCRRTQVLVFKGWLRVRNVFATINLGGTHDQYLTWRRFFEERVMPGVRLSGTSFGGWWIPPIAWNVPGLDGWIAARWNFKRVPGENSPREGPIDVLYPLSAARYFSLCTAVGRDTLPSGDPEEPGARRTALEAGFKWRFSIPWVNVFSGVRVGLRAADPRRLRYPRVIVEVGGGSW